MPLYALCDFSQYLSISLFLGESRALSNSIFNFHFLYYNIQHKTYTSQAFFSLFLSFLYISLSIILSFFHLVVLSLPKLWKVVVKSSSKSSILFKFEDTSTYSIFKIFQPISNLRYWFWVIYYIHI